MCVNRKKTMRQFKNTTAATNYINEIEVLLMFKTATKTDDRQFLILNMLGVF